MPEPTAPADPKPDPKPTTTEKKAAASGKAAPAKAPPLYFKVLESRRVSVNGVVTQFFKDQVLHAAHYSHEGIANLRRSGVPMVETEKPEEYE